MYVITIDTYMHLHIHSLTSVDPVKAILFTFGFSTKEAPAVGP